MITIKTIQQKDRQRIRLEVKGHAGQAEYGHDIVCSAVSILVYTVAQNIRLMEAEGSCTEPPTVNMDSGDTVIDATCRDYSDLEKLLFFAKTGFALLQRTYPDYVTLIVDEA